jgi:hypothetical protein
MQKYITAIVTISCFIFSGWTIPNKPSNALDDVQNSAVIVLDFTGFIASYPISMRLNIKEKTNGDVSYTGYYYYNKVGTKINLSGSWMMRPGTATYIELYEIVNGNYTGSFSLLPKSYGDYSILTGSWMGNGKNLKVKLTKIQ